MDILGKLFCSPARVKIMRLFLLNTADAFENSDVAQKSKVSPSVVRSELLLLGKVGFISSKSFFKTISARAKSGNPRKRRAIGWQLNGEFPLLHAIHNLIVNTEPLGNKEIIEKIKKCGNVKLVVLSGVFIQNPDSRVDILIVGDKMKKSIVESTVRLLESEVGKDISYALFETPEFTYRLSVYDKFVRDILDYPHIKIFDKIGL